MPGGKWDVARQGTDKRTDPYSRRQPSGRCRLEVGGPRPCFLFSIFANLGKLVCLLSPNPPNPDLEFQAVFKFVDFGE